MPYLVRQFNMNNSMNADSYDEHNRINALEEEGWELVTADVSGWPYINTLWRKPREKKADLRDRGQGKDDAKKDAS